jgi:hypothetical protein
MELKRKLSPEQIIKNQKEHHEQQKEQNLQSVKNFHQLKDDENKSANELFNSINNRICALAEEKMSEAESREAARRLINFCELVVNYKTKQNMQLEKEEECKDKLKNSVETLEKTVKSEETI